MRTMTFRNSLHIALVSVLLLVTLLPFLWLMVSSFKTNNEILVGSPYALPQKWQIQNYVDAWNVGNFSVLAVNSIIVAVAVVTLTIVINSLAGFAFAKMEFPRRDLLFYVCLFGLSIPAQAIIIPIHQILHQLSLIDKLLGIILVQIGGGVPFGMFVMRNFFRGLPDELVDAARIDGCNDFRIFYNVLLPLAKPAVLALSVISFMGTWNDFSLPLVVLISPKVQTIPLGLVRFADQYAAQQRLIFAGTVISFTPVILLYIITQRQFIEGMTQGSLKG